MTETFTETEMFTESLVLRVGQILDGTMKCSYEGCTREATMTVANGADPELEPVCAPHAVEWAELAIGLAKSLWNRQFPES